MGANCWRESDRWPLPARDHVVHLGPGTLASAPAEPGSIDYVYDPHDPVPSTYSADYQDAPMDQRILDGRADIIRFVGEPLAEPLEIIGAARLVLHASSDALDTDWHVKLLDVAPDGRAINVATGMLRARWRDGFDAPRLLSARRGRRVRDPPASDREPVPGRPPDPARRDEQRLPELRPQPQHGRRRPAVGGVRRRPAAAVVRRRAAFAADPAARGSRSRRCRRHRIAVAG